MSAALCVPLLVFVALTHARSVFTGPEFEIPEIDGSAVDDICGIFSGRSPDHAPDPAPVPAAITTTTMKAATPPPPPVTRKPPLKKPPPIRPQPAAAQPITNSHSNSAARLLHYLLTNSRGHTGARFSSFVSRPIRGQRHGGRSVGSSSEEDSSEES
ncbi:hypothetical protein JOB18_020570 [Solea senegalensis]|uniref:Uncharacterized protein n=1 Tax=Solea senegalensis TaxID=28829 RepID=A0AAV6QWG1_SOLSE|nr:actin cytoskeleton-regulatory complex protein pan1-like [Solea senegalensis]KAG7496515.1 hypothetical protein JOB18_020570 [Solea senegalensis]